MEFWDVLVWVFGFFAILILLFSFFSNIFTIYDRYIISFSTIFFFMILNLYNKYYQSGWSSSKLLQLSLIYLVWIFCYKIVTNFFSLNLQKQLTYID